KCMNCAGKTGRQKTSPQLVQAATEFLRQDDLILEPKVRWPKSLLKELERALPEALEYFEAGGPKTTIPERVRPAEGRILCMYGDAGWGEQVARGKYESGRFSDAVVKASADLIRNKWRPEPPPQWVTA